MNRSIKIDFYQKPKICSCPWHKIDFLNEDDKYNPFSTVNLYSSIESSLEESLYEKIVDLAMHQDLSLDKRIEIEKASILSNAMFIFLSHEMGAQNVEFKKSSKYYVQSAFAKMSFMNNSEMIKLFFQLIGSKKKNIAFLTNVSFLRCIVES